MTIRITTNVNVGEKIANHYSDRTMECDSWYVDGYGGLTIYKDKAQIAYFAHVVSVVVEDEAA